MPRKTRRICESGIYHVMIRGFNRQPIFSDDEDRMYFIDIVKRTRKKKPFTVFAYCLMDNHVHLLLKIISEPIGKVIQRISVGYVRRYNHKHGKQGRLFQDRFASAVVCNGRCLRNVRNYILQNPVKAGLVERSTDYRWSGTYL